jgi:hypothetical protein
MTGGKSEANAQVPQPAEPPAAAPADAPARPSRRAFLFGGGLAVVAGAGAGVGAEYWRDRPATPPPRQHAPAALRAALAAEHGLLAALDASLPTAGPADAALRQVRADHAAHARALAAAVAQAGGLPPGARATASGSAVASRPQPPRSVAQLQEAEAGASRRAAERAGSLSGRDAALLASIAACEASHAELLS